MIGISGARRNTAVSLCLNGRLQAFCEQERVTRVRHAGLPPGSLPHEAIDAVLASAGGVHRSRIDTFATADRSIDLPVATPVVRLDHHQAHATTAFHHVAVPHVSRPDLRSPVHRPLERLDWRRGTASCDRIGRPMVTDLRRSTRECGALFGFPHGAEHELEALARLDVGTDADRLTGTLRYHDGALRADPGWGAAVSDWLAEPASDPLKHRARVASAFQRRLGQILLELVADIRQRSGRSELCLGGGLFYNTYFTTLVQQSGIFNEVFVAPNPGNAGTAIGAALQAADCPSRDLTRPVSPFLGPEYTTEEIKRTLDNCKLSFEFLNDREIVRTTVDARPAGPVGRMVSRTHGVGTPGAREPQHPREPAVTVRARQPQRLPETPSTAPHVWRLRPRGTSLGIFRRSGAVAVHGVRVPRAQSGAVPTDPA